MTTISTRKAKPSSIKADAIVIGVATQRGKPRVVGADVDGLVGDAVTKNAAALGVTTKVGEVARLASVAGKAPIVAVVGLGDDARPTTETLRRAAGSALRALGDCPTVALALPVAGDDDVRAVGEGALLGAYAYDTYLAEKANRVAEVIVLNDNARKSGTQAAIADAQAVADAVNYARDLVNIPPNDLYPASFADNVKARAKGSNVRVSVTDDKALEAKGYGGILGVGQGSSRPPRLVKLSYKPSGAKGHIALVGKGITFDSGGLSLKPPASMTTMKCDMAGAAAVAAATFAIAELGLPVQVTTYLALAENMPSGTATRPGDVLTMYGGKTVEVLNTDAEGRLVLADAITTAGADKPDLLIDVATLTGACMVALGDRFTGVFTNDESLHDTLAAAGERAGEGMWPMPIPDNMDAKVKASQIADISQHDAERWAGASFAAAFLREFVADGLPWAHLDIAGPGFNDGAARDYTPKGGTGVAVRTLVQVARERA